MQEVARRTLENGCAMCVVRADLTTLEVDAVVNAANPALRGGGGVDGAIHRAGGPTILAECQAWVARSGPLPTGQAMATRAGRLPARRVFHTVGPVYRGPQDAEALASCYCECLKLALEHGCRTVAFPGISTGVHGYPISEAAPLAVHAVQEFLMRHQAPAEVVFCTYDPESTQAYRQLLEPDRSGPD